jgi:hypothetical protein
MFEEVTPELLNAKLDEIKAMLIEVLTWKTEIEAAMADMSNNGGGILTMFSRMFASK